jgi:ABC-type nitrate/sulfonate/bicarbonate transport system substrate-binding protein
MSDGQQVRRPGATDPVPVYYTRCPVPTATGIALEQGMFDSLFAGTGYALRDIAELGSRHADAHYTHSVDRCFREGGASPPVWARSRGADTRLLGITFMDETLGIFVRADDAARTVEDLRGRRIGVPKRPGLVFDFWRFAAEKGWHSALRCFGMRDTAVQMVDIVEDGDSSACVDDGVPAAEAGARRSGYRDQLRALLDGRIDAMFGKGPEIALLERAAAGRIRMLFDLATSPEIGDRVNNSTPRLVTAGARMVREDREAVIRYLQGLLRAARWAPRHAEETREIVARECGIEGDEVDRYLQAGYVTRLVPTITAELLQTLDVLKSFLLARGYLAGDFALAGWVDPEPLREAQRREHGAGA